MLDVHGLSRPGGIGSAKSWIVSMVGRDDHQIFGEISSGRDCLLLTK